MPRAFSADLQHARQDTPGTSLDSRVAWCVVELERVQAHVDDAYKHVEAREYYRAKLSLQAARWGTPHPDKEDPDAERAA
jgi:hypothetical protein